MSNKLLYVWFEKKKFVNNYVPHSPTYKMKRAESESYQELLVRYEAHCNDFLPNIGRDDERWVLHCDVEN
jgi:hypothetical protein